MKVRGIIYFSIFFSMLIAEACSTYHRFVLDISGACIEGECYDGKGIAKYADTELNGHFKAGKLRTGFVLRKNGENHRFEIKECLLDGIATARKNGKLFLRSTYSNNKLHGLTEIWLKNIKINVNHVNGKQIGFIIYKQNNTAQEIHVDSVTHDVFRYNPIEKGIEKRTLLGNCSEEKYKKYCIKLFNPPWYQYSKRYLCQQFKVNPDISGVPPPIFNGPLLLPRPRNR